MENKKAFEQLIDKYVQGSPLSREEQALLDSYFEMFERRNAVLDELPEAQVKAIKQRLEQALSTATAHPLRAPRKRNDGTGRFKKYLGLAASLLVAGVAGYFMINMINRGGLSVNRDNHQETKYTGEVFSSDGGIKQVLLPDGSLIFLNQESELRLAKGFGHGNRHVSLKGEGYFDVSRDAQRPFTISSGHMTIQVLGTTFVAKSVDAEQSVGLLTGNVQIIHRSQRLTLKPGEFAIRGAEGDFFRKEPKEAASLLAWKPETFELTNITMSELADFITKRYGLKLEFKNDKIRACRITHTLTGNETWEDVLRVVSLVNQFSYEARGNRIVIGGQGCAEIN